MFKYQQYTACTLITEPPVVVVTLTIAVGPSPAVVKAETWNE